MVGDLRMILRWKATTWLRACWISVVERGGGDGGGHLGLRLICYDRELWGEMGSCVIPLPLRVLEMLIERDAVLNSLLPYHDMVDQSKDDQMKVINQNEDDIYFSPLPS